MIFVRNAEHRGFDLDTYAYWSEQRRDDDIDLVIDNITDTLEKDESDEPRSYEVIEVQVLRRVIVEREVQKHVAVNAREVKQ